MTPDGKIGGLPNKADNLLDKTKDNANGIRQGGCAQKAGQASPAFRRIGESVEQGDHYNVYFVRTQEDFWTIFSKRRAFIERFYCIAEQGGARLSSRIFSFWHFPALWRSG